MQLDPPPTGTTLRTRRGAAMALSVSLSLGWSLAAAADQPAPEPAPVLSLHESDALPKSWGSSFNGTIHSDVLGEDRVVHIHLPKSFSTSSRAYPVIYLGDGEYYFEPAVTAVHELARAGHIPECIIAAVETPHRRQDFTPPGMSASLSDGDEARGEKFLRFLRDELRPALTARFRAGEPSVLIGHSHGGILCHYAAAQWRDSFPFIIALDAPMHLDDGWLAAGLKASIPKGGHLRLISLEVKFGWSDEQWARFLAAVPPEWKVSRHHLAGEDHESMVFRGFFEGLQEIFADYSLDQTMRLPSEQAFKHYEDIAPEYGGQCIPPEIVLRRALMNLTALGRADTARRALEALRVGFGEPDAEIARASAEIDEAEAALKGQESVEQLLAAAPPTVEQMKPYLGVWRGASWVNFDPERKEPLTVRFSVQDGRVIGTAEHPTAPPDFRSETYKYIRVTAEGIEFGNLNGMYPPGIVANVGRLGGDTISGESTFRGVYFKYPPEMKPPHHLFELKRE